eukprot:SM000017S02868  [mRNA]  locus=s17:722490:724992:- [translate_table: standard]
MAAHFAVTAILVAALLLGGVATGTDASRHHKPTHVGGPATGSERNDSGANEGSEEHSGQRSLPKYSVSAQGSNSTTRRWRRDGAAFHVKAKPPPAALLSLSERKAPSMPRGAAGFVGGGPYGINYNGGPIMSNVLKVYIIWYGSWSVSARAIILNFFRSVSNTAKQNGATVQKWWSIVTYYSDAAGNHVTNQVTVVKEVFDSGSLGLSLDDDNNDIRSIVFNQISSGSLPADGDGAYIVLTDPRVTLNSKTLDPVSGFCNGGGAGYCGWHTSDPYPAWVAGAPMVRPRKQNHRATGTCCTAQTADAERRLIKYAFVGDSSVQCPQWCIQSVVDGYQTSPNNNVGVDGLIDVLAHELSEIATDPNLYNMAWTNDQGEESADLCERGQYGQVTSAGFGSQAYEYNLVGINGNSPLKELAAQAEVMPESSASTQDRCMTISVDGVHAASL